MNVFGKAGTALAKIYACIDMCVKTPNKLSIYRADKQGGFEECTLVRCIVPSGCGVGKGSCRGLCLRLRYALPKRSTAESTARAANVCTQQPFVPPCVACAGVSKKVM